MLVCDSTYNAVSLGEAETEAEALALLRPWFAERGVPVVGAVPAQILLRTQAPGQDRSQRAWVPAIEPVDVLAAAGRALYGERWQAGLAEELAVARNTVGNWLSGRSRLPHGHGVFRDMALVLEKRAAALASAGEALRQWIDRPADG